MKTRRSLIASKLFAWMVAGGLAVAPLSVVHVADAQPMSQADKEKAAVQHFVEGKKKYDASDFAGAFTAFLAADRMLPGVRPARFIGLSADKLRRFKEALEGYERFLKAPPASMKSEADELKPRVAELRRDVPKFTAAVSARTQEGERKFRAGDYSGALAAFQVADTTMVTERVLWFIAQCYEKTGKAPDALPYYEAFLLNPPRNMAKEAGEAQDHITAIKAMPGKVHVETTPPGATVAIDGTASPTVTPSDYEMPAGHHTLLITREGREPKEVGVDVTVASTQSLPPVELTERRPMPPIGTTAPTAVIVPQPTSSAPVAVVAPVAPRSRVPAWITGGLAVAAAGVGTVFGILALQNKSDFDKGPTSSLADDGENHALIADMAFFVAITLGVTSLVLFVSHDDAPAAASAGLKNTAQAPKKKSPITFTATPIMTPHGGGAGATIRF